MTSVQAQYLGLRYGFIIRIRIHSSGYRVKTKINCLGFVVEYLWISGGFYVFLTLNFSSFFFIFTGEYMKFMSLLNFCILLTEYFGLKYEKSPLQELIHMTPKQSALGTLLRKQRNFLRNPHWLNFIRGNCFSWVHKVTLKNNCYCGYNNLKDT